jgi:hypothetical protein
MMRVRLSALNWKGEVKENGSRNLVTDSKARARVEVASLMRRGRTACAPARSIGAVIPASSKASRQQITDSLVQALCSLRFITALGFGQASFEVDKNFEETAQTEAALNVALIAIESR